MQVRKPLPAVGEERKKWMKGYDGCVPSAGFDLPIDSPRWRLRESNLVLIQRFNGRRWCSNMSGLGPPEVSPGSALNGVDPFSRQGKVLQGLCENVSRALLAQRRIFETERRRRLGSDDLNLTRSASAIMRADENYLLIASCKCIRYLDIAIRENLLPITIYSRYSLIRAFLEDVRNMREHDDEYRLGRGRNRDRYVHRDEQSEITVSADWTVIEGGRYLIGGRLSLLDLTLANRHLFRDLHAGGFWVLPWDDLGVAEYGALPED